MNAEFSVGQRVTLIKVPDWLLRDLPTDEQDEIKAFVGSTTTITEIDKFGYFWIGFGRTDDVEDEARYSGHSLCVSADCLAP